MNLYDLGHVPWLESQLIYHALPRLGMEGLILLAPAEPYVCLGYHQDAQQEVDLAYCREAGIPVFRREVGGGAVFLDGQQIFYQLVIHKDNPLAPRDKLEFYQKLLAPVVQTYRALGVDARFKPVNDIITVEGRKISGNGAAEIGDYSILVGNVIVDFDYETMVRVLRVPDAKFRDKVFKSLRENLTTLKRELGQAPTIPKVLDTLVENFEAVLGPLARTDLPDRVYGQVSSLAGPFTSEEWLLRPGKRFREGRRVKISADVDVIHRMHKAPGGLIRAITEIQHGQIVAVGLSGDFFFYPADQLADLEQYLIGATLPEVPGAIVEFYRTRDIDSPGVTPLDLAAALGAEGDLI
jgi:lipoate-protein ligase A